MAFSSSAYGFSDRTPLLDRFAYADTLDVAIVDGEQDKRASAGVPLQIIDSKKIERRGISMVYEAVKTLAGLSVKDYGGIGGLKTVSIRNLGAQHTAISYDGFAISDAQNGQVDISGFMLENVAELSASIGPMDDIFCNARLIGSSGSVGIRTKDVQKPFEIAARVNAGCFGTWNPSIHVGGLIKEYTSLSADVNFLKSDGSYPFLLKNGILESKEIRLNSDVNTLNSEINFKHITPNNQGKFSFKATYNNSERGLPGPVILYYQNPTERLWDSRTAIYTKYNCHWGIGWKGEFSGSYTRSKNRYLNDNEALTKPEDNNYLQQEGYISAIVGYNSGNWKFSAAEDIFANFLDSNIPECPFPVRFNSMTALSAQFIGNRFKITGSLVGRYVKEWLRGYDGLSTRTCVKEIPKKIGTLKVPMKVPAPLFRVSPSVSLTYALLNNRSLMLRASVKDGYRVPTFNDLYYARVGNTALVPEKALTTNIGIIWKYKCNGFESLISIDGYFNYVRDKITAIPTMFIWKMRNIGKVLMAGTDASASIIWTITPKIAIHADANYSFQYAIDITNRESKAWKQQIPYTPKHSGNLVLSMETHWLTATYTLISCGKRYSLPQNIRQNLLSPYIDHSISLGRTFKLSPILLRINAEALNISNINYEIIKGYPMPGRSYRISLKIIY